MNDLQTQNGNGFNGNGHRPIFKLAPVEDDLTFTILNVRKEALEDADLDDGPKVLFVYLLDKSLNRNVNSRPGVVTIAQTKLAEKLHRSTRTIFAWKSALIRKRYVWMSKQPMPNTWPIDTYHISAIHSDSNPDEKTTAEGLWGNGYRRPMLLEPGQGARRPGERSLPLPGSGLPRRVKGVENEKTPAIASDSGSGLPLSEEAGFGGGSKQTATVGRSGLRRTVEADCDGESKPVATEGRSGLRRTAEADCEHIETQVGDKRVPEDCSTAEEDCRDLGNGKSKRFSGSTARKVALEEEREFLERLGQICGAKEIANWGGRWRMRFRESPDKANRMLAELSVMAREQRIVRNAGACANDLWTRFQPQTKS